MLTQRDAEQRAGEIREQYVAEAFGAGMPIAEAHRIAQHVRAEEMRVYDRDSGRYVPQRGTWDVVWVHPRADEERMSLVQFSVPDAADAMFQRTMPTNFTMLREKFQWVRVAAQHNRCSIIDETSLHPNSIYCVEQANRLMLVRCAGMPLRALYALFLLLPGNDIRDVTDAPREDIYSVFTGEPRAD